MDSIGEPTCLDVNARESWVDLQNSSIDEEGNHNDDGSDSDQSQGQADLIQDAGADTHTRAVHVAGSSQDSETVKLGSTVEVKEDKEDADTNQNAAATSATFTSFIALANDAIENRNTSSFNVNLKSSALPLPQEQDNDTDEEGENNDDDNNDGDDDGDGMDSDANELRKSKSEIFSDGDTEEDEIDEVDEDEKVVIIPDLDGRQYKPLLLSNQMKVLLISEASCTKCAVALKVQAGSLMDPNDLPGLAHFCERILLKSISSKYPVENSFEPLLAFYGGQKTSWTKEDSTCFAFEVKPKGFQAALRQFASYFIAPKFTESGIEQCIASINSEFDKIYRNDEERRLRVNQSLTIPEHPYSRFHFGNTRSLWTTPKSKGLILKDELTKFIQKFYAANYMSLVIYGNQRMRDMESTIERIFGTVKRSTVDLYSEYPFLSYTPFGLNELMTRIDLVPIRDVTKLLLMFPVPDYTPFYKAGIIPHITFIMSHEGGGSLLSLLREEDWASKLKAEYKRPNRGFALFTLDLDLTPSGLKNVNNIVHNVFQYIKMLQLEGPQRWLWEEIKVMKWAKFEFHEKQPPLDYVQDLVSNMDDFPPHHAVAGKYIVRDYMPKTMREFLTHLVPSNLRLIVTTKSSVTDEREEWFGVKYSYSKIDSHHIQKWTTCGLHDDLDLPKVNSFLPTDFNLKPRDAKSISNVPRIIHNTDLSRVWFLQDSIFNMPKATIALTILSPLPTQQAQFFNATRLLEKFVNDDLIEVACDGRQSGLNHKIEATLTGLTITVHGYDSKLSEFFDNILSSLFHFTSCGRTGTCSGNGIRFEEIRDEYIKELEKWKDEEPFVHALAYAREMLNSHAWNPFVLHEAMLKADEMTLLSLVNFARKFLSTIKLQWFFHGNFTETDALQIYRSGIKYFELLGSSHIPPSVKVGAKEAVLSLNSTMRHNADCRNHIESCCLILLQTGQDRIRDTVLTELVHTIVKPLAVDSLKASAEPIVTVDVRKSRATLALQIFLQDERDPHTLEKSIENFLQQVSGAIESKEMANMSEFREILLEKKLERVKSLKNVSFLLFEEIIRETYNFQRHSQELKELESISLTDVMEFYASRIIHDAPERRKLCVHIASLVGKDNGLHSQLNGSHGMASGLVPLPAQNEEGFELAVSETKAILGNRERQAQRDMDPTFCASKIPSSLNTGREASPNKEQQPANERLTTANGKPHLMSVMNDAMIAAALSPYNTKGGVSTRNLFNSILSKPMSNKAANVIVSTSLIKSVGQPLVQRSKTSEATSSKADPDNLIGTGPSGTIIPSNISNTMAWAQNKYQRMRPGNSIQIFPNSNPNQSRNLNSRSKIGLHLLGRNGFSAKRERERSNLINQYGVPPVNSNFNANRNFQFGLTERPIILQNPSLIDQQSLVQGKRREIEGNPSSIYGRQSLSPKFTNVSNIYYSRKNGRLKKQGQVQVLAQTLTQFPGQIPSSSKKAEEVIDFRENDFEFDEEIRRLRNLKKYIEYEQAIREHNKLVESNQKDTDHGQGQGQIQAPPFSANVKTNGSDDHGVIRIEMVPDQHTLHSVPRPPARPELAPDFNYEIEVRRLKNLKKSLDEEARKIVGGRQLFRDKSLNQLAISNAPSITTTTPVATLSAATKKAQRMKTNTKGNDKNMKVELLSCTTHDVEKEIQRLKSIKRYLSGQARELNFENVEYAVFVVNEIQLDKKVSIKTLQKQIRDQKLQYLLRQREHEINYPAPSSRTTGSGSGSLIWRPAVYGKHANVVSSGKDRILQGLIDQQIPYTSAYSHYAQSQNSHSQAAVTSSNKSKVVEEYKSLNKRDASSNTTVRNTRTASSFFHTKLPDGESSQIFKQKLHQQVASGNKSVKSKTNSELSRSAHIRNSSLTTMTPQKYYSQPKKNKSDTKLIASARVPIPKSLQPEINSIISKSYKDPNRYMIRSHRSNSNSYSATKRALINLQSDVTANKGNVTVPGTSRNYSQFSNHNTRNHAHGQWSPISKSRSTFYKTSRANGSKFAMVQIPGTSTRYRYSTLGESKGSVANDNSERLVFIQNKSKLRALSMRQNYNVSTTQEKRIDALVNRMRVIKLSSGSDGGTVSVLKRPRQRQRPNNFLKTGNKNNSSKTKTPNNSYMKESSIKEKENRGSNLTLVKHAISHGYNGPPTISRDKNFKFKRSPSPSNISKRKINPTAPVASVSSSENHKVVKTSSYSSSTWSGHNIANSNKHQTQYWNYGPGPRVVGLRGSKASLVRNSSIASDIRLTSSQTSNRQAFKSTNKNAPLYLYPSKVTNSNNPGTSRPYYYRSSNQLINKDNQNGKYLYSVINNENLTTNSASKVSPNYQIRNQLQYHAFMNKLVVDPTALKLKPADNTTSTTTNLIQHNKTKGVFKKSFRKVLKKSTTSVDSDNYGTDTTIDDFVKNAFAVSDQALIITSADVDDYMPLISEPSTRAITRQPSNFENTAKTILSKKPLLDSDINTPWAPAPSNVISESKVGTKLFSAAYGMTFNQDTENAGTSVAETAPEEIIPASKSGFIGNINRGQTKKKHSVTNNESQFVVNPSVELDTEQQGNFTNSKSLKSKNARVPFVKKGAEQNPLESQLPQLPELRNWMKRVCSREMKHCIKALSKKKIKKLKTLSQASLLPVIYHPPTALISTTETHYAHNDRKDSVAFTSESENHIAIANQSQFLESKSAEKAESESTSPTQAEKSKSRKSNNTYSNSNSALLDVPPLASSPLVGSKANAELHQIQQDNNINQDEDPNQVKIASNILLGAIKIEANNASAKTSKSLYQNESLSPTSPVSQSRNQSRQNIDLQENKDEQEMQRINYPEIMVNGKKTENSDTEDSESFGTVGAPSPQVTTPRLPNKHNWDNWTEIKEYCSHKSRINLASKKSKTQHQHEQVENESVQTPRSSRPGSASEQEHDETCTRE